MACVLRGELTRVVLEVALLKQGEKHGLTPVRPEGEEPLGDGLLRRQCRRLAEERDVRGTEAVGSRDVSLADGVPLHIRPCVVE
jgi:hypothetical protein